MSFWVGFAKAKGLGQKKGLVKHLSFGADGNEDISAAAYATAGVLVTIRELEKVDFALVHLTSSPGNLVPVAAIDRYSANQFNLLLAATTSAYVGSGLSYTAMNGINISGVYGFKAFIIGESRKEVD